MKSKPNKFIKLLTSVTLAMLGLLLFATPAFAIDAPDSLQINAVYAYQHCLETDDQLYIIEYYIYYPLVGEESTNPDENVTEAYLVRFMDGLDELKAVAPYAYYDDGYGDGIAAIYFAADDPDLPTWENGYTIRLEGNPTLTWVPDVPSTSVDTFDLWSSSTSITETQDELAARILYLADQLELDWGINMVDSTGAGSYLSDYGEAYFTNAIDNIQVMAPSTFAGGTSQPDWFTTRQPGTYFEHYISGDNGNEIAFEDIWIAQTFTPSETHRVSTVSLKLYRDAIMGFWGNPVGTIFVSIKETDIDGHPTGDDLCMGTIEGSTLTIDPFGGWYNILLNEGYVLEADTTYATVARAPDGDVDNNVRWRSDNTAPTYTGGNFEYSTNAGADWTSEPGTDLIFGEGKIKEAYADERASSLDDTMLDVQPVADWWGVSRMWASSLLFILGAAFLLYAALSPTGNYRALSFLAIPLLIAGGYLGMIPLMVTVLAGVGAFIVSVFLMFYHPSGA